MIKRLLSFVRHMREPTWDDPKASRWADIYQNRARFTGQLPDPEILEKMGIPADNPFWKQDNANPSAAFSVNIDCRVSDALRAESATDLTCVAIDDFGKTIHKLPLSKTSRDYYFPVPSSAFSLDGAGSSIEPNEFVWRAARGFRDLLQKFEAEPDDPARER